MSPITGAQNEEREGEGARCAYALFPMLDVLLKIKTDAVDPNLTICNCTRARRVRDRVSSTIDHGQAFVNYAKILAYNTIFKFPDNGPIMLRNAPIMLKVLALFLSNLCTSIQKKKKKKKNMTSVIYYCITEGPVAILRMCCSVTLYFESSPRL